MNCLVSRRVPFLLALVALGALAVGCQRVHVGEDDGGGSRRDAGVMPADGGGGGRDAGPIETCGPVQCAPGQVCCNPSCGICTAPGEACIEIACGVECASNADCTDSEYCALSHCPDGTRDGTCVPRADECPGDFSPVCGCDDTTYSNACAASSAGVVVERSGECAVGPCSAMDARGEGDCLAALGVVWNGTACVGIGGCECVGADCGSVYPDVASCDAAHAGCRSCAAQDARGDGPCDAIVGVFWNGSECVEHSGCDCVGSDCGEGWTDPMRCEAAHLHCSGGCTEQSDCDSSEWCKFPPGSCGGPGTCEPVPPPGWACAPDNEVCGCDGVTYDCQEMADSVGAYVASVGACGDGCAAMDATGSGACAAFFGYAWDGSSCVGISGCDCVGADCGATYDTPGACEAAYRGCDSPPGGDCGGFAGLTCRPDEWCDYPEGTTCGFADHLGTCRPRPEGCFTVVDPHCGCDGVTYSNECEANRAGFDVSGAGSCMMAPGSP